MRISLIPPPASSLDSVSFVDGSDSNLWATKDDPMEVVLDRNATSGWYESLEIRESTTDRPQDDGSYWPSRLTTKPRVVTIRGHIVQHDQSSSLELALLNDNLNGMIGQQLTLLVEDVEGRRTCDCYLSSQMSWTTSFGLTNVTLIATCPDPLKYGVEQTFDVKDGVCTVRNDGNAPTWPIITLSGPCSTLSVEVRADGVQTAGKIVWSGSGPDGMELDLRDMVPTVGRITVDNAVPIMPGRHVLDVTADNTVMVHLRPAWR